MGKVVIVDVAVVLRQFLRKFVHRTGEKVIWSNTESERKLFFSLNWKVQIALYLP